MNGPVALGRDSQPSNGVALRKTLDAGRKSPPGITTVQLGEKRILGYAPNPSVLSQRPILSHLEYLYLPER